MMLLRIFKKLKAFFPLFIFAGFINAWGYLRWIGRLDIFPLIINNVTGVIAVLITSLLFCSAFALTLLIPSAFSSLTGEQSNKKTKLKIKYNEGCCAATALAAVVAALTLMFTEEKISAWHAVLACIVLFFIHSFLNYRFNCQRQKHHRELLKRLKQIQTGKDGLADKRKWAFLIAETATRTAIINLRYTLFAVLIAGLSFLPLLFLLQSDIYFSDRSLLLQYAVIVIMYIFLFLPVLLALTMNKDKTRYGIKPVMAFSPAIVIAVFSLFSVQLIQINQRSIEIVGMASWHERLFAFKADSFPDYYFPKKIWGASKITSRGERLIAGIEAFSNGETHLICPRVLKALRETALKNNAFTWQTDEKAKAELTAMSQYCLLAKSDQLRSSAALVPLFNVKPR